MSVNSELATEAATVLQLIQEKAYLGRTNDVNPFLRVVMEVNPDAWSIAAELDMERAQGRLRG